MKKAYSINIIRNPDRGQAAAVVRALVKERIQYVLAKNGLVSTNLDDVLEKFIPVD